LNEATNKAIDDEGKIESWEYISDVVASPALIKIAACAQNIPCFGWIVKQILFDKVQKSYDVIINYIDAHHRSLDMLKEYIKHDQIVEALEDEINANLSPAEVAIRMNIEVAFPDITLAVNHRKAEYFILRQ